MLNIRYLFIIVSVITYQLSISSNPFWALNKNNTVTQPGEATVKKWMNNYIGFEKNAGQIQNFKGERVNEVLFRAKLPGYSIYITPKGISYVMYQIEREKKSIVRKPYPKEDIVADTTSKLHYARFDIDLKNANINPANVVYENPLPGYSNYYLPSCPDGALNVVSYQKVTVKDIYPGIDWVWEFRDGQMHYEFYVHPGADPQQIQMKVKWADVQIKEDGKKVEISTPLGKIEDGTLKVYEAGSKKPVKVVYQKADDCISLALSNPIPHTAIIIDPPLTLVWATYYGGSGWDNGNSITTDANGNVFVTGETGSTDFPTQNPGKGAYFQGTVGGAFRDAFILKFDNNGVRQWATYYGGNDWDEGNSITTDLNGNVFLTGYTKSTNFPTYSPGGGAYFQGTCAGGRDAFILKFNNNGVCQWATYYGGSDFDYGNSITTDVNGNVFVTGFTRSNNLPTQNPGKGAYFQGTVGGAFRDAFILKFDNNGVRQWATYYGGNDDDVGASITTDVNGNVFVTGRTESTNFPTYSPGGGAYFQATNAGIKDIFILKFDNNGVCRWATYYGGNGWDGGYSITTDAEGNVFVTGETKSTNLPTYNPGGVAYYQGTNAGGFSDAFILKFDNNGVRQWATYYGGNGVDYGKSITTDANGNVFVTGYTGSTHFPTQNSGEVAYFQGTGGGNNWDAFILKFDNNGVRQWATYYRGSKDDFGGFITTDENGNVFVTGSTESTNFPTLNPGGGTYFQVKEAGRDFDAFIVKFGVNNNYRSDKKKFTFITGVFLYEKLNPVKNAKIALVDENDATISETYTDQMGRFKFERLVLHKNYMIKVPFSKGIIFLTNSKGERVVQLIRNGLAYTFKALPYEQYDGMSPIKAEDVSLFTITLFGQVYKKLPGDIPPGLKIEIINDEGEVIYTAYTGKNGFFRFEKLSPEQQYLFRLENEDLNVIIVDKEGKPIGSALKLGDGKFVYERLDPDETIITLINENDEVVKIRPEDNFIIPNIYYDYGKWDINTEAARQLDKLALILKKNPHITIELSSHTDSRGDDDYNLELSQKRAQAAIEYLKQKGIDPQRLYGKGYGETKLVNECDDGVECPEEKHQENRRTEFKIIKWK